MPSAYVLTRIQKQQREMKSTCYALRIIWISYVVLNVLNIFSIQLEFKQQQLKVEEKQFITNPHIIDKIFYLD